MMTDLAAYQARINDRLAEALRIEAVPDKLREAMAYAVLGGGKRVRPCLVYLAAEAAGAPLECADATACAVEMIHAYSLVHDDLPSMDDDQLRRGQPTCHIQFDEATAILVGDALQARAFELLATDSQLTGDQRLAIIQRIARAAGPTGMVAGQVIDLASEQIEIPANTLIDMHHRKTGALITASVVCGGLCANADETVLNALSEYGYALGLAFQVQDDILDESGDTERLGKQAGADRHRRKSTFVSVYGLEAATEELERLRERAVTALAPLGDAASYLAGIADFVASRDH